MEEEIDQHEKLYSAVFTINHEIDHNPKPEDLGRIKVYANMVTSESVVDPILNFSLPAKDFSDNYRGYRWGQLDCLEQEDERVGCCQASWARSELPRYVSRVMLRSSSNYSPECALVVCINFKCPLPLMMEESIFDDGFRFEEESVFVVNSGKIFKTSSSDTTCPICLDEFKIRERVVTLPCGHEFDDTCILDWFDINHVCPLCRFELS